MPFKRQWDSSCPRVWSTWEADGVTWVVQDLPPADDELAVRLLLDHLAADETMCIVSNVLKDEHSVQNMTEYWRACLAMRTSLACYAAIDGKRTLAALNCCIVKCDGEEIDLPKIEGDAWLNVCGGLNYAEKKVDTYKLIGTDRVLHGMGLVVSREYRGAKLGWRVLAAREPMCRAIGLRGTSTVFSVPASQKSASRAGFITVAEVTFRELADAAGLKYPREDTCIKTMIKKYE